MFFPSAVAAAAFEMTVFLYVGNSVDTCIQMVVDAYVHQNIHGKNGAAQVTE